jgi:hypothetical protein
MEGVRQQDNEAEQPEQARGGATDRARAPLALGLQAEVRADLLEGALDVPVVDIPAHALLGRGTRVGAEEGHRIRRPVRRTRVASMSAR